MRFSLEEVRTGVGDVGTKRKPLHPGSMMSISVMAVSRAAFFISLQTLIAMVPVKAFVTGQTLPLPQSSDEVWLCCPNGAA